MRLVFWALLIASWLPADRLGFSENWAVDRVLVEKAQRRMTLMAAGRKARIYPIALGANPVGHKRAEGDEKTPEGAYRLDWRNANSGYFRSIHISYPGAVDRTAAASAGIDPGGMIMIHGQRNHLGGLAILTQLFDWTDGCIAVTNSDMQEIWALVPDGTPIEIRP